MAQNEIVCPVCDQSFPSDTKQCPNDGWLFEAELYLGGISPEKQAKYHKMVETARRKWQADQTERACQEEERRRRQVDATRRAGDEAVARGNRLLEEGKPKQAAAEFEDAIRFYYQHIRQTQADLTYWHAHYLDDLNNRYQQRLAEIDQQIAQQSADIAEGYQQNLANAGQTFDQAQQRAVGQLTELRSAFGWIILPWNDPAWNNYTPPSESIPPVALRLGRLDVPDTAALGDLPALVPFAGQRHLFLQAPDPAAARQILQSLLLRLVVSTQPRSVNFTLMDPDASGANLAGFRRLPDDLRGPKIFARPEEMAPRIDELITHIETVIQQHLTNLYANLEDYNAQEGGKIAVPYRILVLTDFPAGFNETMLQKLLTIARTGPKAGVYILASLNPAYPPPQRFQIEDIYKSGAILSLDAQGRIDWQDPDFGQFQVIPDPLPDPAYSNAWMDKVAQASEQPTISMTFKEMAIAVEERWRGRTIDGLRVPIGINGVGERHFFELGKGTVNHGLIGGMTQSGKTNLLHVLIIQLALLYPPEELELYLLDFKEGVEFADYARIKIPHVRVLALHSEREYGLSALNRLQEIIEERGRLFKAAGVTRYADYRRQAKPLPRLLVVMDEYQVLFQEDDPLAREAERLMEDLTSRGAGFGLHILLSTQSPARGRVLSSATYDQLGLRIALKCYPEVARNILGEGNLGAEKLVEPGQAVYNDSMGQSDKNQFIRVAFLPAQDRPAYLKATDALCGGRKYPDPDTFDPDSPADLVANKSLLAALQSVPQPAGSPAHLWLGEPIAIKAPTAADVERYVASNLLVMCDDEAPAYGLLAAAAISLAAQRAPQDAAFTWWDFTRPTSAQAGWAEHLRQALTGYCFNLPGPRQAGEAIAALAEELQRRKDDPTQRWPEHLLLIAGLGRWRELRPVQEKFGPKPSETAQKLALLASEGPENGLHLVVWTDDLAAFYQVFDRSGLNFFDLRAALHLSEPDSNALFGSATAASKLEGNRAVYHHESWKTGRVEKFKPYPLMKGDTLEDLAQLFGARRINS